MSAPRSDGAAPFAVGRLETKPTADVAAFGSLDLRVGRVVAVAPFPEARRPAYKLTVDFGPVLGQRRTSAQVTEYAREDLVGRQVVGVLNLGTRRIAGFDSEFLVLGAMREEGGVALLDVDDELPPGSVIA